jgi:hypothetical protein
MKIRSFGLFLFDCFLVSPTKSLNASCKIPFIFGGFNRSFCVENSSQKWICDIGNGITDECDRGDLI